jgi:hypothetical protein
MDNQHKKIKGYRDLSQVEIDLMNAAKTLEAQCLDLHTKILTHLAHQEAGSDEERQVVIASEANRWLNIGKTDVQKGLMAYVRAIAKPGGTGTI